MPPDCLFLNQMQNFNLFLQLETGKQKILKFSYKLPNAVSSQFTSQTLPFLDHLFICLWPPA